MRRAGAAILLLIVALSACSAPPPHPAVASTRPAVTGTAQPGPAPRTTAALVRIAQVFNDDYDDNNGPVWDRWDARSQAVISRAEYIRRHAECATAPQGPAHVESATPGAHGSWLVQYELGGQQTAGRKLPASPHTQKETRTIHRCAGQISKLLGSPAACIGRGLRCRRGEAETPGLRA